MTTPAPNCQEVSATDSGCDTDTLAAALDFNRSVGAAASD